MDAVVQCPICKEKLFLADFYDHTRFQHGDIAIMWDTRTDEELLLDYVARAFLVRT